ncbi:Lysophospholipase, alpha-beta hydrolase superfamily [Pseudobutyrivibrio sp. YE44]|uniref:alpha/beta fold hydrolase n=1 Tax=Pseudobutyrivibrio sp. YE44 TaxID=1520802 RepID=UPI00088C2FF5|nr:alpha/beta fold hydrolase [Pseudobutyrivibrio sp. YE44]SDB21884.1 Lysophospholipase, alpha-beta hydrolase superfamily [Pseudobutyrivibrio sp. YE44]
MITQQEYTFNSKDGHSVIHCRKWLPEQEPIAVIQLVHGMVEYIERYDEFATFLATKGYVVVGHDHIGHGHSVADESELGVMTGVHPSDDMVEDIYTHYSLTRKAYPALKYFILGHSMGSYMLRKFLSVKAAYIEAMSGAIIMGTGFEKAGACNMGLATIGLLSLIKGKNYRSTLIRDMTYSAPYKLYDCYGKDYANSWLSKNMESVEKYYHDPLCTFTFTLNAYKGLVEATKFACTMECASKMRAGMPLLVVSGDADPVGNLGEGTRAAADLFKKAGVKDVTLKLYHGDRHEILNELDRETVYEDIYKWLEEHR